MAELSKPSKSLCKLFNALTPEFLLKEGLSQYSCKAKIESRSASEYDKRKDLSHYC